MSIQELEEQGYKVWVGHYRQTRYGQLPQKRVKEWKERPNPRGGMTCVDIVKESRLVASGRAYCSGLDNYNKKLGRTIALGRALKQLKSRES